MKIEAILRKKEISLFRFKDHVIFEEKEIQNQCSIKTMNGKG